MLEKSITNIIKQELKRGIKTSPFWSIMIDETISDEKHLEYMSQFGVFCQLIKSKLYVVPYKNLLLKIFLQYCL